MDDTYSLLCTPRGLGELTYLCTLSIFIVGEDTSQQIHQIKELNLGGKLCIKGLDNVSNLEDAKSANLISKMNLTSLTLVWAEEQRIERGECFNEVLEGLQPHHNLEQIVIERYPGSQFPNWMSSRSFTNVKEVDLQYCQNCVQLPPLGKLPSLTCLSLVGFILVKHLGVEWLGDVECSFPALTSLDISEMYNLKDWSIPDSAKSFPNLTKLSINWCPKLERLPCLPRVENLSIHDGNKTVLAYISVLPSLKFLKLDNCSTLESFPEDVGSLNFLKSLIIDGCDNLTTFPADLLDDLPFLASLEFVNCKKLKPLLGTLKQASSLSSLHFWGLPGLQGLPECMQQLTCLRELYIEYCDECFLPTWFGSLESLSTLVILDCKKLKSLPESFSGLKSLKKLDISGVSGEFEERCKNAEGEDWPKISHIPYISINYDIIQLNDD